MSLVLSHAKCSADDSDGTGDESRSWCQGGAHVSVMTEASIRLHSVGIGAHASRHGRLDRFRGNNMSKGPVPLIAVVLLLVGAVLPRGYSNGRGDGPSGGRRPDIAGEIVTRNLIEAGGSSNGTRRTNGEPVAATR